MSLFILCAGECYSLSMCRWMLLSIYISCDNWFYVPLNATLYLCAVESYSWSMCCWTLLSIYVSCDYWFYVPLNATLDLCAVECYISIDLECVVDCSFIQDNDCSQCEGSDAVQLRKIFQQLESVKDDSQQRSWFLHEDEGTICQHLEDLISILVDHRAVFNVLNTVR